MLQDLKEKVKASGDDLFLLAQELLETAWDGRIKLYVISRTLNFRRQHPDLFLKGGYVPLEAAGETKSHVLAFMRRLGNETILVGVPRLVVGLTRGIEKPPLGDDVWKDTWLQLPGEERGVHYRDLFTGRTFVVEERGEEGGLLLSKIFDTFPVAFLERIG